MSLKGICRLGGAAAIGYAVLYPLDLTVDRYIVQHSLKAAGLGAGLLIYGSRR